APDWGGYWSFLAKAGAAAPSGFAKHRLDSERRRAVPENPLYYVTAFASWRGEMSRARLFTRNGNRRRSVRLKRYRLQLALGSVSAGTLLHAWRGARLLTKPAKPPPMAGRKQEVRQL